MIKVMKTLRPEDVFYYHDLVITSTGGDSGVKDRGLVESAYYSAFRFVRNLGIESITDWIWVDKEPRIRRWQQTRWMFSPSFIS